MAAKKIPRKKLKEPDEFITVSSQLLHFVMEYKIQILSVLGVGVALALFFSVITYYSNRAENKASALLEQTKTRYETMIKENGMQKAKHEISKDFNFLAEKYPKTVAGKLAMVNYANICYANKDYDKAITLYEKAFEAFNNNQPFSNLILSGLGYSHEGKKDYNMAAKSFEMIASGSNAVMKDEAIFNLGRLYALMGDDNQSAEAFKKIISEHADSIYLGVARERIGALDTTEKNRG